MISHRTKGVIVVAILLLLAIPMALVFADGNETLGPPSVGIASGSGYVAAGTGMNSQPGTIHINVPGNDVVQVLLYWAARFDTKGVAVPAGDDTVTLNGSIPVTGTQIGYAPPIPGGNPGGPGGTGDIAGIAYRADITGLGLISNGPNSLTVSDFRIDGSDKEDGAALIVIFDDGVTSSQIDIRDGSDVAYLFSSVPAAVATVPQTFTFSPASFSRTAVLTTMVGDIGWDPAAGRFRSSSINVWVDGVPALINGSLTSPLVNVYRDLAGAQFDVLTLDVAIPAGATQLTVQPVSSGNDPASLNWIVGAFSVPSETLPANARITGGGWRVTGSNNEEVRTSNGLTLHCDITLSNNLQINWDQGQKWHINKLVDAAFCEDDPAFTPEPPRAPADTYIGLDVGKLNNVDGAVACFILEDHGEVANDPDGPDQSLIRIWKVGFDPGISAADLDDPGFDCLASTSAQDIIENTVLFVPLSDVNGNLQFHFDQPHKNK